MNINCVGTKLDKHLIFDIGLIQLSFCTIVTVFTLGQYMQKCFNTNVATYYIIIIFQLNCTEVFHFIKSLDKFEHSILFVRKIFYAFYM